MGDRLIRQEFELVSVGLPVYNGGKSIERALFSLLNQTYKNIEIIISDNGSSDTTQDICTKFAFKASNIKYYRYEDNMGARWNFSNVLNLSSGKFFMFAAHDDYWDETYIRSCYKQLNNNPNLVLCFTGAIRTFIDQGNKQVFTSEEAIISKSTDSSFHRFFRYISHQNTAIPIYGLMRKDVFNMIDHSSVYLGIDRGWLAQLAILGEFGYVPEPLIFLERQEKTPLDYYKIIGKKHGSIILPKLEEMFGIIKSVWTLKSIPLWSKPIYSILCFVGYFTKYRKRISKEIKQFLTKHVFNDFFEN